MPFQQLQGATLVHDVSGLKPQWVKTQRQLNQVESENIFQAMRRYVLGKRRSADQWFHPSTLRRIHRDMLGDVWTWAGEYRDHTTNIGSAPYRIPHEVMQLCDDVQFWIQQNSEIPLIEQAARIHHRLVAIHPFENGNGRHARLVMDLYLRSHQHTYPHWPVDLDSNGSSRRTYIDTLRAADQGDYEPLVNLLEKWSQPA